MHVVVKPYVSQLKLDLAYFFSIYKVLICTVLCEDTATQQHPFLGIFFHPGLWKVKNDLVRLTVVFFVLFCYEGLLYVLLDTAMQYLSEPFPPNNNNKK